jgi:hypothetical protein
VNRLLSAGVNVVPDGTMFSIPEGIVAMNTVSELLFPPEAEDPLSDAAPTAKYWPLAITISVPSVRTQPKTASPAVSPVALEVQ